MDVSTMRLSERVQFSFFLRSFEIIFNSTASIWFLTNGSQSILINNANRHDAITNRPIIFCTCVCVQRRWSQRTQYANTRKIVIARNECRVLATCAFGKSVDFGARRMKGIARTKKAKEEKERDTEKNMSKSNQSALESQNYLSIAFQVDSIRESWRYFAFDFIEFSASGTRCNANHRKNNSNNIRIKYHRR